jgi:hypothetical protein
MADQHKYVINLLESNIERKIDNYDFDYRFGIFKLFLKND